MSADMKPLTGHDVLRYVAGAGMLDIGSEAVIDYRASLNACAGLILAGHTPAMVASSLLRRVFDSDLDALSAAAQALGPIAPISPMGRLCVALQTTTTGGRFAVSWEPEGVRYAVERLEQIQAERDVLLKQIAYAAAAPQQAAPPPAPAKREFRVAISYNESVTYDSTVTVMAVNDKDAAAEAKRMAENPMFDFGDPTARDVDAYHFEVTDPDGPVTSWRDDEEV